MQHNMSSKIKIQLKPKNQILETKKVSTTDTKVKLELKKKEDPKVVSKNENGLIDLKVYHQSTLKSNPNASGKKLIVDVMTKLINFTETKIKQATGDERKKHQFRSSQFRKAVAKINECPHDINSGNEAKKLDGIGKGIADRIDEIIKTGTLKELKEEITVDEKTAIINELMTITGIGESHAKAFCEQGVTSINDLIEKVKNGAVKITHHMQIGLDYHNDFQQKIPYSEIADLSVVMKTSILQLYPDLIVEVCGSHRRKKPVSGDIDVLITHKTIMNDDDLIKSKEPFLKNIVNTLTKTGFLVASLTSQGNTKYMGVCKHNIAKIGRRVDIRFVTYDSYAPALLYFTGSKDTNKYMRSIALEKGYTLNEYGLYRFVDGKKESKVIVHTEKEVFDILGIAYLDPIDRDL